MINYEIHFFRADGTLGLRLLAAASDNEEVMRAVDKMRSQDFASVKIFRGVHRARVRHRPAMPQSDVDPQAAQARSGPGPKNYRF